MYYIIDACLLISRRVLLSAVSLRLWMYVQTTLIERRRFRSRFEGEFVIVFCIQGPVPRSRS